MIRRTKRNKKVSAIFCADMHLRESTPICRTDDFWKAQWAKVDEIKQMQRSFNCPVIHSGDLFDNWKASPYLLSETIKHLPEQFWTIYGNHDLPQHNLELANKSGIYTLLAAGKLNLLPGCHWLETPCKEDTFTIDGRKILVWHIMAYQGKVFPGCTDKPARSLIRKYTDFDVILTGHNHKSFVETFEDRILVNPGSLTRQKADQIEHRPKVYLWYAEDNSVEEVLLNYEDNVISSEHLEKTKQRDDRIEAFINTLDSNWESGMNFEKNLDQFLQLNPASPEVEVIINQSLDIN